MAGSVARAALAVVLLAFHVAGAGAAEGARCPLPASAKLATASPPAVLPKRVLSHRDRITPDAFFDVIKEIGSGAFGSVSVASLRSSAPSSLDPANGPRLFAIKEQKYPKDIPAGAPGHQARTAAHADKMEPHFMSVVNGGPYLVHFWGAWREQTDDMNSFSIAMPIAKSDLEAEIAGKGKFFPADDPIPENKARILLAQLALAIGHMHSKGILHRDIKAGNILLDSKRRPMLADFGCAINASWPQIMKEHVALGFCDFRIVAPEIWSFAERLREFPNEAPFGRASDWFSYGVVAFDLLTRTPSPKDPTEGERNGPFSIPGYPPDFHKFWRSKYGQQVGADEFLDVDYWRNAGLSSQAGDLIFRLLHPDPSKRLGRSSRDQRKLQGWQAVLCHPFFAPLQLERLIRAGGTQAMELNEPVKFNTRDGQPPTPGARANTPPANVPQQVRAAASEAVFAYGFSEEADGGASAYLASDADGGGRSRPSSSGSSGGGRNRGSSGSGDPYLAAANAYLGADDDGGQSGGSNDPYLAADDGGGRFRGSRGGGRNSGGRRSKLWRRRILAEALGKA
ncbi:kinase-like domain-containing protein [Hyaloraphidium curvatum]|nr:kinase-like domain-containing protein [Hyaloraphidium curvatum]